jgi:hypothetical protein
LKNYENKWKIIDQSFSGSQKHKHGKNKHGQIRHSILSLKVKKKNELGISSLCWVLGTTLITRWLQNRIMMTRDQLEEE